MAKKPPKSEPGISFEAGEPINLGTFDTFKSHVWVSELMQERYRKDATLATYAVARMIKDLEDLNLARVEATGRVAFTTVEGRVKDEDKFFNKLYGMCCRAASARGVTQERLRTLYGQVTDLCGVRFSCPYFDEVETAVQDLVRPSLSTLGYATDLQSNPLYEDEDNTDLGNEMGYRSYHFFVKVPTQTDIYGTHDLCLCEVQARSELQHVWAVKSHDLLYKPDSGWELSDKHVVEDMRQVSNSLRAADQHLLSIRDRARSTKTDGG